MNLTNLQDTKPVYRQSSEYTYDWYLVSQFRKPGDKNQALKRIKLTVASAAYTEAFQTEKVLSITVPRSSFQIPGTIGSDGRPLEYRPLQNDNIQVFQRSNKTPWKSEMIYSGNIIGRPEYDTSQGTIKIATKSIESIGLLSTTRGNRRYNRYLGQGAQGLKDVVRAIFQSVHLQDNTKLEYLTNADELRNLKTNLAPYEGHIGVNAMHDAMRSRQLFIFTGFGGDEDTKETILSFFTGKDADIKKLSPRYRIDTSEHAVQSIALTGGVAKDLPMSYTYHHVIKIGQGRSNNYAYQISTDTIYNFGGMEGIQVNETLPIPLDYLFENPDEYAEYKRAFALASSHAQVMDKIKSVKQRMDGFARYKLMRDVYGSMFVDVQLPTGLSVESSFSNILDIMKDPNATFGSVRPPKVWSVGETVSLTAPEIAVQNKKMLVSGVTWRYEPNANRISLRLFPMVGDLSSEESIRQLKMTDIVNRLKQKIKLEEGYDEHPDTTEVFREFLKNPKSYELQLRFMNPLYDPESNVDEEINTFPKLTSIDQHYAILNSIYRDRIGE